MSFRSSRVLLLAVGLLAAQSVSPSSSQSQRLQQAVDLMETKGDYPAAIRLFEEIAAGDDRSLAARALFFLGLCQERLSPSRAETAYRQVLHRFSDQREVASEARARLGALSRKSGSAPAVLVRQVWTGPDVDTEGAPSPDGRYLPYVVGETGDLAVRDLIAGTSRPLTSGGSWQSGHALYPIVSADGKQIAYAWYNQKFFDLRLIRADGSGPRVLYSSEEVPYIYPQEWSTDGNAILALLFRKDKTTQIALLSTDDGSAKVLKTLPWRWPQKMSLSADGRYLAYDLPQEGSIDHDVFLLATDGSRELTLVEHPADDFAPLWTPDGTRVLFLSDRTGSLGLWLLNVSNPAGPNAPVLLREDLGRVWPLGITRQGGYYYALQTGITDVYVASLDPDSGRLIEPPHPVSARLVGARQAPDWSPDGRHLVYPSDRTSRLRLFQGSSGTLSLYSVASGEEKEIRTALIRLGQTRWLSDGRTVLMKGWDDKEREGAYLVDIETGSLTTLVQPSVYMQMPELTPDGKTLFYRLTPEGTGGFLLIARDVASGRERELYRHPAGFNHLALSPDGTELAFTAGTALVAISSRGGVPREVLRLSEPARITTIAWTPDGRQIFFGMALAGEGTVQVFRVAAQGGEPLKTDLAMKSLSGLRFHPDGRRVAFVSGEYAEEVWVLENFLPAPVPTPREN